MAGQGGRVGVGGEWEAALFADLGSGPSWGTAPGTAHLPEAGGPHSCGRLRVSPEHQAWRTVSLQPGPPSPVHIHVPPSHF